MPLCKQLEKVKKNANVSSPAPCTFPLYKRKDSIQTKQQGTWLRPAEWAHRITPAGSPAHYPLSSSDPQADTHRESDTSTNTI